MNKATMNLIKIRDILGFPETNPNTWLYLPPDPSTWTMTTKGVFSLDCSDFPPDSDDYLPEQAKKEGWIETLEAAVIEDLIVNVKYQVDDPTEAQLLQAFIFYYENDGFIEL